MTPFEAAQGVYEQEDCANTFGEDLFFYLRAGYVWSSRDAFAMARPVMLLLGDQEGIGMNRGMIVGQFPFVPHSCNCWHVHLAAGDWKEALGHLPYSLEYISFERDNVFRYYPLNHFSQYATSLRQTRERLEP